MPWRRWGFPYETCNHLYGHCLAWIGDGGRAFSGGDAAEPSPSGYTSNQVVRLALQHNPVMNGAEAVLEQSQSRRVTPGAYLKPTIRGSAGRGSIRDPAPVYLSSNGRSPWSNRWSGGKREPDNAPLTRD